MSVELLVPVPQESLSILPTLPRHALGNVIIIHSETQGLPDLKGLKLAIVGVPEIRNCFPKRNPYDSKGFRNSFYRLYPGNWKFQMADLGDLPDGATPEDTYFAVNKMVLHLIQMNIIPIIIGGSQDLIYPVYQTFQSLSRHVNIVSVDNQFDFSQDDELISGNSYMHNVIMESPNVLDNYTIMGYQSFYCAQEEQDLIDKLYFDTLRLGNLLDDPAATEPLFRDADIVGFDMKVLSWEASGDFDSGSPNGIDSRTICALSRYAGISDRVSVFGVFEQPNTPVFHQLLAQIVWYFIEGIHCRFEEYPIAISQGFIKYTVALSDREIVFYKSEVSQRWWMQLINVDFQNNILEPHALLPCTQQDYEDACQDKIPQRWYNAIKRLK